MTKEERKEYMKEWCQKNREKINRRMKEYKKEYRQKNKEKLRKQGEEYRQKSEVISRRKEYYEKNKDILKKRTRDWAIKNGLKHSEYYKEYYLKNKDKFRLAAKNSKHRRRAKMKGSLIPTKFLIELKLKTTHCEICGKKLKGNIHLDHIIPLNIGGLHIKSNVRYVHAKCNLQRPKNGSDIIQFKLLL